MKDYQVKLISEGSITQIPDSPKVFGALVYLFAEKYGSEEATRLTKAILEKEIHFMLSSVMPYGYLPTPQDYLLDNLHKNNNSDEEKKLKELYSFIKERSYITYDGLKVAISNPASCNKIYPYVGVDIRQQLRASIESIKYDIPELESRLFSVPVMVLSEINRPIDGEKCSKPITEFSFNFQIDDSKLGECLLEMLREAAKDKVSIVLGKRASQGMNLFEINDIVTIDRENHKQDLYLNLGMFLPDCIDFEASTFKLFTSERRPFEMQGGWEQGYEKQFISFVAEGSVVAAPKGVKGAGKSIKSPFNKARDIVFGNAYLYPLPMVEKGVKNAKN